MRYCGAFIIAGQSLLGVKIYQLSHWNPCTASGSTYGCRSCASCPSACPPLWAPKPLKDVCHRKRPRITMGVVFSCLKRARSLSLSGSPVMRQKFGDAVDGVIGNASEDVFKPGAGLNVHALTGSYETAQHGSCPTTDIATKKHPVAATHGHATNAALCACVVDFQIAVLRVAVQRRPVFERVAHGAALRTLGQYFSLNLQ